MTEELLYKSFFVFGEIESIKIMTPKIENSIYQCQTIATKNIAFINFFKPEYAKGAVQKMDGKLLMGHPIKIKWGKQSNIKKIYSNCVSPTAYKMLPHIFVTIPENQRIKEIIDKVAKIVAEEGYLVEKYLLEKESNYSDFHFLIYQGSLENIYYRWRVYSFIQGDTETFWRQEPFQFNISGNIWHPPVIGKMNESKVEQDENVLEKTIHIENPQKKLIAPQLDEDSEEEEEADKPSHIGLVKLNKKKLLELQNILQNLTSKRKSIKKAMKFCFDNVPSANQISITILESIIDSKTPQEKVINLIAHILYQYLG